MTIGAKPPAEVAIDSSLVRALLLEQHADLASLPMVDIDSGWDNRMYRLGENLAVRLPRRAAAADLIENEQRWLPVLSPRLPLAIPVPLRTGRPSGDFPWPWSVVPWLDGQNAAVAPPRDAVTTAFELGQFLRALHQPAPNDAPRNPWRGVPLAHRTQDVLSRATQLGDQIDGARVVALWGEIVRAPPWSGPPLWIHGDLHPGNLLVSHGRVSAVVDFGDLTGGDPATDLSAAWMMLPPSAWPTFRTSARGPFDPIDDHTWVRARGWALALGLAYLASSRDDPQLEALGRAAIHAVLNEHALQAADAPP